MKSLQRRFDNAQTKHPRYSSYLCFAAAVYGQKFSPVIIRRWFNKLVERDDYVRAEKKAIIRDLIVKTNV